MANEFDPTPFLTQDEGQHFDRKSLFHGPPRKKKTRDRREVRDQVAKYVAAFANAEGGVLILGLEDDGEVTGHAYRGHALESLLQVPKARLQPELEGKPEELEGKPVELEEKPVELEEKPVELEEKPAEFEGKPEELEEKPEELEEKPEELDSKIARMPNNVRQLLDGLGHRPRRSKMRETILAICSVEDWTAGELAQSLGRNPTYLTETYLTPLVDEGLLERTRAARNDPRQGYRTTNKGLGDLFEPEGENG